ncbi:MAG: sugar phosphate nucleotidyltransferase [Lentisphaeria bacterium]|nr:sugar phosphate nucleotidyltransferase [Lentisphaeria bacterium]
MSTTPTKVRKAVIPAAGLGTRMFPATKAIKKEMFPVVTPDGVCKPLIHNILEEAAAAGAEDFAIIVRPGDEKIFSDYFSTTMPDYFDRLPAPAREQAERIAHLARQVTYITQNQQLGFGHAIHCTSDWVGNDPFLLLVGDHIYFSFAPMPCAAQLTECFQHHDGSSVISLYQAPGQDVHHYGTVCGTWLNDDRKTLRLSRFVEKPSLEFARRNLAMPGLPDDTFLCVYGQYVLTADIFPILAEHIAKAHRQKGEIQLTPALDELRQSQGMLGHLVDGEHYDTGQPFAYVESLAAYAASTRKEALT